MQRYQKQGQKQRLADDQAFQKKTEDMKFDFTPHGTAAFKDQAPGSNSRLDVAKKQYCSTMVNCALFLCVCCPLLCLPFFSLFLFLCCSFLLFSLLRSLVVHVSVS